MLRNFPPTACGNLSRAGLRPQWKVLVRLSREPTFRSKRILALIQLIRSPCWREIRQIDAARALTTRLVKYALRFPR